MSSVRIDSTFAKKAAKLLRAHPDKRSKVERTIQQLAIDPFYPSLKSKKYDEANGIWQSYIESRTPSAWRIWWVRDDADTITVIDFGPHP